MAERAPQNPSDIDLSGVDSSPLDLDDDIFDVITELLPVAARWKDVGIALHLKYHTLDNIDTNEPCRVLQLMAKEWLDRNYNVGKFGEPTWQKLVDAVNSPAGGANTGLARDIAKRHKPGGVAAATPQTSKQIPIRSQEDLRASSIVSDDMFTSGGASVSPRPSSSSQSEGSQKPPFGCGCGKCTFFSYIKSGCTNPNPSANSFPYLDLKKLTREQQQALQSRLHGESEDIMRKFGSLFSNVYESLRTREIPVNRLATHLLLWGEFDPVCEGFQKPVLQAYSEKLRNARSIEDVLSIIRPHFSFFNYHVVEHIVSELGTDQDKVELRNYKEEFDLYSKRRVIECPRVFGSVSEANDVELVLKLDSVYEKYTVQAVKDLVRRLDKILHVPQGALRLCRVEEDCLQLTFQVPSFVQEIFPLSSEQESALVAEGVIKLTCGNYEFIAKGEVRKESEPEDTGDTETRQRKLLAGKRKKHSQLASQLEASPLTPPTHLTPQSNVGATSPQLCPGVRELPSQHPTKYLEDVPVLPLSLEEEIKQFEDKYIYLVVSVRNGLKRRGVSFEIVRKCLLQLPVSLRQYAKILQSKAGRLSRASSIDELFFILSPHWNFQNPNLLAHLAYRFGDDQTIRSVDEYLTELRQFRMRTKTSDFIDKWTGTPPPVTQELVMKLGDNWKESSLEQLEELRIELSRKHCFDDYVMPLKRV